MKEPVFKKRYACGHEMPFDHNDYYHLRLLAAKGEYKPGQDYTRVINMKCPECLYNEKVEAAELVETKYTLPALTGTEKQIKWAKIIRAEFAADFLEEKPKHQRKLKRLLNKMPKVTMEYAFSAYLLEEDYLYNDSLFLEGLSKNPYTSSKFWIDHIKGYRHYSPKYFFYYEIIDVFLTAQNINDTANGLLCERTEAARKEAKICNTQE